MSLGESDAKFPGQEGDAIPPSPTRENPAAVYPKSSPHPAGAQAVPGSGGAPSNPRTLFSNPFAFDAALAKLHRAFDDVIGEIGDEARSGLSGEELSLSQKFKGWRSELDAIRKRAAGQGVDSGSRAQRDADVGVTQEGGMFTD